jgi:hypothetical protein
MHFWELFVVCGTIVSVFAIYMEYRSKGVGLLFGGGKRKDRDAFQREFRALQSQMQAMQENLNDLREMMADMVLTLDEQKRLDGSESRTLPPSP